MALSPEACDTHGGCSHNTQLGSYLQQWQRQQSTSPSSAPPLSFDNLARYPLPVLTGAGVCDIHGVDTGARPTTAAAPQLYDGLCAAAGAIQHYWQTSTAIGDATSTFPVQDGARGAAPTLAAHTSSWLTHSPFRVCAQEAFHARLRRCATLPTASAPRPRDVNSPAGTEDHPWTAMDAMCHGVTSPSALSAPSRSRKRGRVVPTATQTLPQLPTSQDVSSITAVAQAAVPVGAETGLPTLRSHIHENVDLLDMLLGVPATATSAIAAASPPLLNLDASLEKGAMSTVDGSGESLAADRDNNDVTDPSLRLANRSGTVPAQVATSSQHNMCTTAPPQRAAEKEEASFSGSSLRDLKEACLRRGLLCTGTKSVLAQRIALYEASRPQQRQQQRDAEKEARREADKGQAPLILPAFTAVRCTRAASGSPPRTIFRYRSPSLPCGVSSAAGAAKTAAEAPVVAASPPLTPPPAVRRVVPSPTAFLQQLMSSQSSEPQLQRPSSTHPAHSGGATHTAAVAASRAQEETLKGAVGSVRWQWLVDYRERAVGGHCRGGGGGRSKHEGMMDAFRRQQVPCSSVLLPSGDFMLAVDLTPGEAFAVGGGAAATAVAVAPSQAVRDETQGVEASPLLGHVCSLVVERKTAADLDASVKGSRYREQRRLLAASPFALVVWLIEGSDQGSSSSAFFHARSPSPVPGGVSGNTTSTTTASPATTTTSPAESVRQRVDSACVSLGQQQPGWLVVRTRNTAESVFFLRQLAEQVARQLASYRLACRAAGASGYVQAEKSSADTLFYCLPPPLRSVDHREASSRPYLRFAATQTCLQRIGSLQRRLRAQTAFPRMLLCVRGCSASLAAFLANKYGSLLGLWRVLRRHGREACDADPDVRRLSTAQKKVLILLTEFILSKDYY